MKKLSFIMIIALLVVNTSLLIAQKDQQGPLPGGNRPDDEMLMPPPLSDQQKEQMKELRIAHMKEVQPVQNELRELKARYRTLVTAANPNTAEINKNIDSQTATMNKLMKSRTAHQQEIRKILTDEQRLFRDMNLEKRNARKFKGNPGPGMGKGMGNLPGRPGPFCPWNNDFVPPCLK